MIKSTELQQYSTSYAVCATGAPRLQADRNWKFYSPPKPSKAKPSATKSRARDQAKTDCKSD